MALELPASRMATPLGLVDSVGTAEQCTEEVWFLKFCPPGAPSACRLPGYRRSALILARRPTPRRRRFALETGMSLPSQRRDRPQPEEIIDVDSFVVENRQRQRRRLAPQRHHRGH